jgi:hypothetical protein
LEARIWDDKSIQVSHAAILPQESTSGLGETVREADNLLRRVNRKCKSAGITVDGTEIGDATFSPKRCVELYIPLQIGPAGRLALLIDRIGICIIPPTVGKTLNPVARQREVVRLEQTTVLKQVVQ